MSQAPARSRVSELLEGVDRLPSIPAVALEIVRLTEDENCTLDEFAAVLSRDPALSGKVLRMANSSLFNLNSPVSTLQRATMVLGMRTVKLTSLTFSLAASLPSEGDGPFDLREYWRANGTQGTARIRAWLDANGIPASISVFLNSAEFAQQRIALRRHLGLN